MVSEGDTAVSLHTYVPNQNVGVFFILKLKVPSPDKIFRGGGILGNLKLKIPSPDKCPCVTQIFSIFLRKN